MWHRLFPPLLILALLFSSSPVKAQEQPPGPVYIVQSGDTLSTIAVRFGVSLQDLLNANQIADPNAIGIGAELVIPGLEGVQGKLVNHIVPLGENLHSVSLRYQLPEELLVRLNRVTSPNEVYAGVGLIIVRQDGSSTLAPVAVAHPGESLLELSVLADQKPWALEAANRLQGAWDVLPGDVLLGASEQPEDSGQFISPLVKSITVNPLPLIQGATTSVIVQTTEPVDLSGDIAGQHLSFFQSGENQYAALLGIPALQETGLSEVTLQGQAASGVALDLHQMILLAPGNFVQEVVSGVAETTIDEEIIRKEDETLAAILEVTPEKLWSGKFTPPVDEPCVISRVGNHRSYNNGSYHYYHTGLDFAVCAQNLNIYAAAPGIVVFSGPLDVKGNFTAIDHGWGVYTGYAHQVETWVKPGDRVEAGQQIGIIGNTGRSVGPHLHWEVWIHGVPVNPWDWIENEYP